MSEKHVEATMVRAIRDLGGQVDEFSQRRPGKCRKCGSPAYAGTQQTVGIPDLRAVFPKHGLCVWLEVKYKYNRPTPHQRAWMFREHELGIMAAPVWTLDDLIYVLKTAGLPLDASVPVENVSTGTHQYVDHFHDLRVEG